MQRAESHNQHSRRVVLLVTLDVRNAFNSARWCDMLHALEHKFHIPQYLLKILDSYLRNRTLVYDTTEGQRRMEVTAGAAQGSILGPDLWNVAYDDLLRQQMPEESLLVGYADDVAVLIAARDLELAQLKLNQVMRVVNSWMEDHGLSLALNKTEVVILTKKRINTIVPIRVGDEQLETKGTAKYLGITIDSKLNFGEQIRLAADKAAMSVATLSRLMANIGGPAASKRRLLMSTVQSILLYGAEVWADALRRHMYRRRLVQVQRTAALRVASAYRTVSEPAVMVIAGVIPVTLLARERRAIYLRKAEVAGVNVAKEERTRTIDEWQISWERDQRGRWTRRLIPRIQPWIERLHGEVGYYLTQFLSGHGYFSRYLHRMGKRDSPDCPYCVGVPDDALHTFFYCERWADSREELESHIGELAADTVVEKMLREENYWNLISRFIQGVLRTKKTDLDRTAV